VTTAVEPVRTPPELKSPPVLDAASPQAAPGAPARRALVDTFTRAAVATVLVVTLAI